MSFCANCGKQLAEEARFCTSCGTAVGADASAEQGASVGQGFSQPTFAVAAQGAASSALAADAAKPASFKAAMDSTKARGKRRMPVIVLVALALALTSAIALAAHYIYSEYVAPAMNQSVSNASDQPESPELAAANAAYAAVIEEYRLALNELEENGDEQGMGARYPHVSMTFLDYLTDKMEIDSIGSFVAELLSEIGVSFPTALLDLFGWTSAQAIVDNLSAAKIDLDENGIPELLIYHGSDIVHVLTCVNGEVVSLAAFSYDDLAVEEIALTKDGLLLYSKSSLLEDRGVVVLYAVGEGSLSTIESLSWQEVDDGSGRLSYSHATPEGVTETTRPRSDSYHEDFQDSFRIEKNLGGQSIWDN